MTLNDETYFRRFFPKLSMKVRGEKPLIFLDNSSEQLVPTPVVDRLVRHYQSSLGKELEKATDGMEESKEEQEKLEETLKGFLHAPEITDIVYTKNSTESANMLAEGIAKAHLKRGDEVLISAHDYDCTYLPWLRVAEERGIIVRFLPFRKGKSIEWGDFREHITLNYVSSYSGVTMDPSPYIDYAKKHGIITVVDGAQAVPHIPVNLSKAMPDFFYFSSYKVYSVKSVGVILAKSGMLDQLPPRNLGSRHTVSFSSSKFVITQNSKKFHSGSLPFAAMVGLRAGIDFIQSIGGIEVIEKREKELLSYAYQHLDTLPGLKILDKNEDNRGFVSFVIDGWPAKEIREFLDREGTMVAYRPRGKAPDGFFQLHNIRDYVRLSFAVYNTKEELAHMIGLLEKELYRRRSELVGIPYVQTEKPKIEMIHLTAPFLTSNHIGAKESALRPVRKIGPRLEEEKLGEQRIFHNYGHGGSGFVLSPIVGRMAVEKCMKAVPDREEPIAVLGAGIIGLMTAWHLVHAGYRNISLIADEFEHTTSQASSAHFSPVLGMLPEERFYLEYGNWIREAYQFWTQVAEKEIASIQKGVRKLPFFFNDIETLPIAPLIGDIFSSRDVILDFGSVQHEAGIIDDYIAFDPTFLLTEIRMFLRRNHVRFQQQQIMAFQEVSAKVIFNCVGIGARALTEDRELLPVQGHHVYLHDQHGKDLNYGLSMRLPGEESRLEFVPKLSPQASDGFDIGLLGQSRYFDEERREANAHAYEEIVKRARRFFNTY